MKKILNDSFWGKIVKTFMEGFLSSLIVTLPNIQVNFNFEILKSLLIGAIAMGISAVLNLIQEKIHE